MKRLQEMDVAESVKTCVIAGPADLMTWEVSACLDSNGMTLEVIGRGSDLEAAAASAIEVLSQNGSTLETPRDGRTPISREGETAIEAKRRRESTHPIRK